MIEIKNLEEMKPYYNRDTNTYEFAKNGGKLDVCFNIPLNIKANIKARNIKATDIKAQDINADSINASNINAWDINSWNIDAKNIEFYAICCAYNSLKCITIKGKRENSKYFCLENNIEFIEE